MVGGITVKAFREQVEHVEEFMRNSPTKRECRTTKANRLGTTSFEVLDRHNNLGK